MSQKAMTFSEKLNNSSAVSKEEAKKLTEQELLALVGKIMTTIEDVSLKESEAYDVIVMVAQLCFRYQSVQLTISDPWKSN